MGSDIRTCFSNSRESGMCGYDEFGKMTDHSERVGQPFGFTGYQWDDVSNTYYAQTREYSSSTGAFISKDSVNDITGLPRTLNHYAYCFGNPNRWIDENGRFPQQAANQLISDYLTDEYGRAFEAWKDDISNTIDNIGKSVHNGVNAAGKVINDGVEGVKNGVSDAIVAVNEFWNNEIYGVDVQLYNDDKTNFMVKSHTGGGVIVAASNWKGKFIGWSFNLAMNIPFTDLSISSSLSGKSWDINSWKTKNYVKIKDPNSNINYSAGYGANKEGVYLNESWGGGTDKLPLILPNGVSIQSYTNVTWSISKDEIIAPWDTVVECVRIAVVLSLAIALIPETGGGSLLGLCAV